MNKKIYFGALVALSLFACNQAEEPQPSIVSSSENVEGTFELNLSATVSSDAMRALSFQGLEDLSETPKISANSDFTTHAFFRKAGSPEVGYATIHWEAREDGGRVKLIRPTTNIALANMSDQTIDEGEEWYVSGIAGGGVLNSEKTAVSFEPDLSSAAEALRAPIAFKWTRIYKNKMINVHFQPKGVLLRAVVANHVGKDVAEIDFDMTSNELDYNGKFDFSAAANSIQAIEQGGHEPVWKFSTGDFGTAQAATLKFRAKDFAKDSKQRIMVWGMSRELSSGQKLTVKPSTAKTVEVLRAGRPYLFESKVPMENTQGYTIEMELDVVSPALLFAEHNVNQAGTGFATNDHTESGRFTWQRANELSNSEAFNGYHLPTAYEQSSLLHHERFKNLIPNDPLGQHIGWDHTGIIWFKNNFNYNYSYSISREWTDIGSIKRCFRGEYKSTNMSVGYALRFLKYIEPTPGTDDDQDGEDAPDDKSAYPYAKDNRWRTAFRYTWVESRQVVEIEMLRIGEDPSVIDVNTIADPGWWTAQSQKPEFSDRIYKMTIALNGLYMDSMEQWVGQGFHWWSATEWKYSLKDMSKIHYKEDRALSMNLFGPSEALLKGHMRKDAFLSVRLIKDMDI